jgi:CRISPR-associated protein Cas8a1/Csx13
MAKLKSDAPDHLTMNLFAPGMSPLHRAGLGGLACTLAAMDRLFKADRLPEEKLPAPFDGENPSWQVDHQSVTLQFGTPEKAGTYLEMLFGFAFGIRNDGLISLPGQYERDPSAPVLADLQLGLILTFLQHGKVRKLAREPSIVSYDPEGEGLAALIVQYRKCSGFKHQDGWHGFVDDRGCLKSASLKVDGPINPGAVVRHVAFTAHTAVEEPPRRMLPLYFAVVGCLPLPVNRGVAALLVPEVDNLLDFIDDRPAMTPTTARQCQIANAADAALQAQVRLRARHEMDGSSVPGCYAMTFRPTPWASQQKSRVETIQIQRGEDRTLDRFERALSCLPTRVVIRTVKETSGKGKKKLVTERQEAFRADSIVRPLIAENLALGLPWYSGFVKLMTKTNPATNKPYRKQLSFERKGIHEMISDSKMWDTEGERLLVQAIHEAIRQSLGRIREQTDGKKPLSQATKNRWERFREKLRLDLAGAKLEAHVRFALMDLFSRGGNNPVLKTGWEKVLPIFRKDWRLTRDLALLALASYAGRGGESEEVGSEAESAQI